MEQVKAFLYRRRLWLVWLAAVAVCALALLWVRYDLADRVDNQPVYQIVNDDYARTVAIPAQGGLTQQISLQAGQRLYGVRLNLTNYEHAFATGVLHVALESPQGDTLTAGTMNCIDIRDNTFETIIFTEPYRAEDAAAVTLHIWYADMDGADADLPLGLWASNIQVGNMALAAAGGPLDATAALQYVVDYSENWSGRMLLVPGMLILAAVVVSFWLLFGRTARPALAVLAGGALLGAAFVCVTPPLVAPDEYTHLSVAYQLAGSLLGQPTLAGDGSVLVRACDAPYFLNQTGDIGVFAYKTMGEHFWQGGGGIPDTPTGIVTDMTGRIPWLYLGQVAGIALARLLGLGFFAMLALGRLGNLLVYLLLAALAVRLAHPGQKWLFAAAALLPMALQLAGSLSADAMVLGLVFCYAALCLALRQRAAAPGQLLLLLALAALTGPAKAIYLPVVLLCLLIPSENLDWRPAPYARRLALGPVRLQAGSLVKILALALAGFCWMQANLGALLYATRDVDSVGLTRGAVALATAVAALAVVYYLVRRRPLGRRIFFGVLISGVVVAVPVVLYNLTHMWGGLTPEDLVDSIQPNGDSIYTFSAGYVCRNLPATLKLLLRSLPEQGALWLEGVLGTALGEPIVYRVEVSWLLGIGLLAALAAAALPADGTPRVVNPLSGRGKAGIALVTLCVVGLTFFAALNWTPINYTTIFGVQGRYWLPVLPLLLVLLNANRRWFARRPAGRGAVYAVLCLTSFVLLQGYSLYATWQVTT
ncbi:DUF2142 domain-containing protein [uncultured Gemmiger sp.]|uniref:DUF2142 domain-containing protein n=1 Tax=uncultured Gemmiger sp. TaxID=1623490 RepID=UPI0025EA8DC9|nr:DUF2142 domain-containing protein [uncultured Gemmiger sp.]